jgi:hypothetical protein
MSKIIIVVTRADVHGSFVGEAARARMPGQEARGLDLPTTNSAIFQKYRKYIILSCLCLLIFCQ